MEISGQIHKNSLNYSLFSSVNSSIGLSGVAGDASTMFFGTISGGITAELTGGNFWQGAATGLVVSGLNHVANKMAQPNNRPSKSNRRLERLERQGKVRSLTENEMALAKSIFGDNIDYQSVKIVRAKYYFLQSRNYAVTPNGNIYYPQSEADWTNVNGNKYIKHRFKEFLIHELTHVWQYQSGINVLWSALPLQILKFGTLGLVNPYTIPQNNMNFQSLNVEQQGSYMEGVFNGIYTNPF